MWLTEEKAREIACPIFALAFFLTAKDDRLIDDACQGSRCAWWRWSGKPFEQGFLPVGFCGHAGVPAGDPPRGKRKEPSE